jgi:hypothetical protein
VRPQFFSSSLTDEFRPTDKLLFNLGIRLDSYTFDGSNTNYGPARQFYYNAYNNDNCINHVTGAPYANPPGTACAAGDVHAYLQNLSAQTFTFNIYEPRIAGTYTLNSDSVVRFSFGRYSQAPNAAFEQYNTLQNDIPFTLLGPNFLQYGRNAPGLPITPPTSLNYDVSFEQRLKGTDWSFKLTPFLRQTQDQIQQFFLNQKTGFVSGTNIGSQRSQGIEFQAQKGDFSKNGIRSIPPSRSTTPILKRVLRAVRISANLNTVKPSAARPPTDLRPMPVTPPAERRWRRSAAERVRRATSRTRTGTLRAKVS